MNLMDLELFLENIESPTLSTCTQSFNNIPMLGTGIKRLLITGTLAGTLAISSLGNVLRGDNVKLKSPIFSEESLVDYNNTIEEPYDDYISELSKLISHKVNMTRSEVVERVIAFKSLNQSWDGYGAIPLEVKSAANAVRFIYLLNDKIVEKLSDIYSTPNGTVSFVWENDDNEGLSLELGNNTLSYYVKLNSQKPIFCNNIEINADEANTISDFIKTI
ncbi:MAG: hypothetical protein ACUZ8I_08125 [Candidatus Scalindua sp.]